MKRYIGLTITVLLCVFKSQASVICEQDFSNSTHYRNIGEDGSTALTPEPLNFADFFWGPWTGYEAVADSAIYVGSSKQIYEIPVDQVLNTIQPIWFSMTLDLQSHFALYPLGTGAEGENLYINFDSASRMLGAKGAEETPASNIKLSRTDQYILIGKYDFVEGNRTRLQFVAIPTTNEVDLSQEFDFANTDLPVYIADMTGQPSSISSIRMLLDSGSLVGNLRIGSEYTDITGYAPPPVVEEVIAPVVEKSDSPMGLFIGGGVLIVIIIAGVIFAVAPKKKKEKKNPQATMAAMAASALLEEDANKDESHNGLVHTFSEIKHHDPKSFTPPPAPEKKEIPSERAIPKFIEEEKPEPKPLISININHDDEDDDEEDIDLKKITLNQQKDTSKAKPTTKPIPKPKVALDNSTSLIDDDEEIDFKEIALKKKPNSKPKPKPDLTIETPLPDDSFSNIELNGMVLDDSDDDEDDDGLLVPDDWIS